MKAESYSCTSLTSALDGVGWSSANVKGRVQLYLYSTSGLRGLLLGKLYLYLDGVGGQRHAPAVLPPGKDSRYPLYRKLGGPQGRSA